MILLTGAAGFIGRHVAEALLQAGARVVGVDDLNAYYDPALKRARLRSLAHFAEFRFVEADVASPEALRAALDPGRVEAIVHLAAQAGVRHSLTAPFSYEHANVKGHLAVLEYARGARSLRHLIYASSSSVYGERSDGPFHEDDRTDAPASLYAATKKACELMSESYARLYGLPQTGLRFFTVYGPWGRPDMAVWLFSEAILEGRPVTLYGQGRPARDFTFIGDVAPTVARLCGRPPQGPAPHRIYNLGNSSPVSVERLVETLEQAAGRSVERRLLPMQPGEVASTFADIRRAREELGFEPRTALGEGAPQFIEWLRAYRAGRS
jgi:UDP-glucuronate 4-epimerase